MYSRDDETSQGNSCSSSVLFERIKLILKEAFVDDLSLNPQEQINQVALQLKNAYLKAPKNSNQNNIKANTNLKAQAASCATTEKQFNSDGSSAVITPP